MVQRHERRRTRILREALDNDVVESPVNDPEARLPEHIFIVAQLRNGTGVRQ